MKTKIKNPIERSQAKPKSLRAAINAKCYDCNCGENWTQRTRYCRVFGCPLWRVRPFGKGISVKDCENANIK